MVKKTVKSNTWEHAYNALDSLESEYLERGLQIEELREELAEKEGLEEAAEERDQAIDLLRQVLPVLKELQIPETRMDAARAVRSVEIFLEDRPKGAA